MINIEKGTVERVLWAEEKMQCLEVKVGGKKEKAINYLQLSGSASPGNGVILNTTAVRLGLGSGGYHFVIANTAANPFSAHSGHIMKMRYTPLQLKLMTWEERGGDKNHYNGNKYPGLHIPVVIGELHSMIAPFARTLKLINRKRKIVYIMSDSASLPLPFSSTIRILKEEGVLEGTITSGQAFGGDLETVNIYTALLAAREEFRADVVMITPGPGVVGTATRYGFSGIEQGEHVERVHKLGGIPLVIPRISFADPRSRHKGISHHTLTALGELTTKSCFLPLPACSRNKMRIFFKQLAAGGLLEKHKIVIISGDRFLRYLEKACAGCQTMGRNLRADPVFFAAVVASACLTEKIMENK
ncbi:MAG: DUF3866 family protein [Bacillota bacterium]